MQVAVAAYAIDWHNRWNDYVGKLRVWVRTACEGGAQVLVFPEFAALEVASLAGAENAGDPGRAVEALTARLKDIDDLHASLAREFGALICAASGPVRTPDGPVRNRARLFSPEGGRGAQDKLTPDPEESATWGVGAGAAARVFETAQGRIGVLIGGDVAAPGLAAAMARAGAAILLAPGRTADAPAAAARRAAALRRAEETGCVLAHAVVVGEADWSTALGRSTGAAAVLAPTRLADDGVLAEGKPDAPGWVQGEAASAELALAREAARPAADETWTVEVLAL